jgi:DNA-binding transcriptional LysR family regulator
LTVGVHTSLSAGNLRATLVEHRKRFPDVELELVDGSSEYLIFCLAQSIIDIAFVLDGSVRWDGRSLGVWTERIVAALPEQHPLASAETLRWTDLRSECFLLPHRGPGLELKSAVLKKLDLTDQFRFLFHDVSLDRLLTLVGAGWGIQLALEGATGAAYPGVAFREVCDHDGPTRLGFSACWRHASYNPALEPFLDVLRERYPDLSAESEFS